MKPVLFAAILTLAAFGPSPEAQARFQTQRAAIWQFAGQEGATQPLAIAQKYRSANGVTANSYVALASRSTPPELAGQINACMFDAVGRPPLTPMPARSYGNHVYPAATPADLGKALDPSASAVYLRRLEGDAGVACPIIAQPAMLSLPGTGKRGAVPAGAVPFQASASCPSGVRGMYRGTLPCQG